MGTLIRMLLERLGSMLSASAATALDAAASREEAKIISDLLREAERYEADGQPEVAARLRQRAATVGIDAPDETPQLTEAPRRRGRPPKALRLEEGNHDA